ncbi:hypothetical protein DDM70_10145 [Vibrio cholerae]|nr:hypothetical protein [Vibrio cholerae]EGR3627747.1 hypothetical protein [Vibrio cholerae]EGR3852198.1 hypothetical protein [Vibrio cholerae]EGR4213124.1 hypothetical protein [Vibrio cholerae]EGR4228943.1 hypothetical protein [Vibrio cholerae]
MGFPSVMPFLPEWTSSRVWMVKPSESEEYASLSMERTGYRTSFSKNCSGMKWLIFQHLTLATSLDADGSPVKRKSPTQGGAKII